MASRNGGDCAVWYDGKCVGKSTSDPDNRQLSINYGPQ